MSDSESDREAPVAGPKLTAAAAKQAEADRRLRALCQTLASSSKRPTIDETQFHLDNYMTDDCRRALFDAPANLEQWFAVDPVLHEDLPSIQDVRNFLLFKLGVRINVLLPHVDRLPLSPKRYEWLLQLRSANAASGMDDMWFETAVLSTLYPQYFVRDNVVDFIANYMSFRLLPRFYTMLFNCDLAAYNLQLLNCLFGTSFAYEDELLRFALQHADAAQTQQKWLTMDEMEQLLVALPDVTRTFDTLMKHAATRAKEAERERLKQEKAAAKAAAKEAARAAANAAARAAANAARPKPAAATHPKPLTAKQQAAAEKRAAVDLEMEQRREWLQCLRQHILHLPRCQLNFLCLVATRRKNAGEDFYGYAHLAAARLHRSLPCPLPFKRTRASKTEIVDNQECEMENDDGW